MKKAVLILSIIFAVSITAQAQQIKFSAGPEIALPMGDFGDIAGTGIGASLRGEYPINEKIVGIAEIGYLTWGEKETFGITSSYSAIPIQVGAKYYFNNGFYGIAEAGMHLFTVNLKIDWDGFGTVEEDESTSDFGFGFGAGYEFPVDKFMFDVNAKYQIISDINYLGLRAGVKFAI
ncbi:MAG: hypothetical protein CVV23_07975 [Ignavibacteriae bacterium HGW-Ignavibacteriae-2]|jgi:opacity protein-like surface antigen|nr:MAG: hypothetical protein CVV23_07975 [Ignavibacteriae bacterium HGW-Ignavibacteriae-2]